MPRAKKTATDTKAVKKTVTKETATSEVDVKKLKATLKKELKKYAKDNNKIIFK